MSKPEIGEGKMTLPLNELYFQLLGVIIDDIDRIIERCNEMRDYSHRHKQECTVSNCDHKLDDGLIERDTYIINTYLEIRRMLSMVKDKIASS